MAVSAFLSFQGQPGSITAVPCVTGIILEVRYPQVQTKTNRLAEEQLTGFRILFSCAVSVPDSFQCVPITY